MNQAKMNSIPVALPPIAEQKRIVAKVDELMALCDQVESQQQEREKRKSVLVRASLARFAEAPMPANLGLLFHKSYDVSPADLRKTILTLAVQGKLVSQDPDDEPAASLMAQIDRKKQVMTEAKKIRPGKVSRPHSALDAPKDLPSGWEWVNVDALCFKVTDGTHLTPQYTASGVRFVSAKDIVSGKLVFDRCKFISQEEHGQLYRRCNPEYHDIVISKSGSIGTVALVEDRDEFSLFESLALLKFDQTSLFSPFLVCALTHACALLTTGHIRGVGVKHLHLDILRGLELAIPPLVEQQRIVAKVDQLMALVDELERQQDASRATASKLLDAIVHELTDRPMLRDGCLRHFGPDD
jgi:type I restriction enzyme S subunit